MTIMNIFSFFKCYANKMQIQSLYIYFFSILKIYIWNLAQPKMLIEYPLYIGI